MSGCSRSLPLTTVTPFTARDTPTIRGETAFLSEAEPLCGCLFVKTVRSIDETGFLVGIGGFCSLRRRHPKNARILLANPAYSHLARLVAQEGASNANSEAHVGTRSRCPNLATWRFNWGSPTVSEHFTRARTCAHLVLAEHGVAVHLERLVGEVIWGHLRAHEVEGRT